MFLSRFAVLCTLPLLALGMKKRAESSTFGLYGYAPGGLGGFPLYYADGYAYVGNASQSNSSDAAPVTFSRDTNNVWIGNPNTTHLSDPTAASWSNMTFYVPDNTTSDKRVGFLAGNASTDSAITTGFFLYGSTVVLVGESGTLESNFFALRIDDNNFRLYWNDTSLGQFPVMLRSVGPSNPPDRRV